MRCFTVCCIVVTTILTVSCATVDQSDKLTAQREYCDRYFAYPMCVSDITGNGQIDFMYFSDTNEVFMLAPEIDGNIKEQLTLHECVQVMDENLRSTASKLLYIDQNTPLLQKTYLKSQLIIAYSRYMNDVNRCHGGSAYATSSSEEDFGNEDFGEL